MKKILRIFGAVLIIVGILLFFSKSSLGIIGGEDGPTAVFTAGILSGNVWIFPVTAGILLVIASIVKVKKKK
ncbi:MAG: sodium ion-translocating decarboxylase subunit beta [Ruminococcus sp.]|nr:sodium ion-translocating decarboxylase subunit beta [Ruminococcus sp.]MCM1382734.1 sodium ion-translocating decarboxylase subunit beta [Muribaculaceae bacterium]